MGRHAYKSLGGRLLLEAKAAVIAFIFPSETFGGHEKMSLRMIESLQSQRTSIHCYVSHRNERLLEKLKEISATVHITRFWNSRFDIVLSFFNPNILFNIFHLRNLEGTHRHLILVNGNGVANHATTLAVCFYAWRWKIRATMYIPMVHTAAELKLNVIKAWFYEASIKRSIKFVSDVWTIDEEWTKRVLNVKPGAKTCVIRNLVKPVHLSVKNKSTNLLIHSRKMELCFVGRVEKVQKGLDYLLNILGNLEVTGNVLVHIVGDGPDLDWLKHETINRDFNSKVVFKFHGWISNPIEIVSNCDAVIMPSRVEGVPLAAIEALMVGTPVFAFAIPGVIGLVENKFLARPFLVDEFSEKLNAFLLNPRPLNEANGELNKLMDSRRFECELNCAIAIHQIQ
jgi:glycosyltransferase involved in cell wall biosynthesis